MTGLNNTISMSMKIVHNKFTPLISNGGLNQVKDIAIEKLKRDTNVDINCMLCQN